MYIQNLKQDNVYTKPKTGQYLCKTYKRTMFVHNLKQDNVHINLKTGHCV